MRNPSRAPANAPAWPPPQGQPVARPAQNIRICVASPTVRGADGDDQNGGSRAQAADQPAHLT